MGWLVVALKSVGTVLGAAWPFLKQRFAERSAGRSPIDAGRSITDGVMDAALLRLGALSPEDPLWKRCFNSLDGALVRPDLFDMPSVREWLSKPQVLTGIKQAAEVAISRGAVPQDVIERLSNEYADSTGDDRRFADQAIRIAIAFLQASVQGSVRDSGTAAIVQATTSELARKLDGGMAQLAEGTALSKNRFSSERSTQDGRNELNLILRRRVTEGQKSAEDLQKLIRDFELGGRLAAAEPSLQDDAAYWLARVEAAEGNATVAADRLIALEKRGYTVPPSAWALVDLAKDDFQAALQRLRESTDADSQSVLFYTLLKRDGQTAALQYVDDLGVLSPSAFTATGWNNVCASLFAVGRLEDAAALLGRLPADVLSQCTRLYYMYAVSHLLPMLSTERQLYLINHGFLSLAEHVLDSPESLAARARALETIEMAKRCAIESQDSLIAEQCAIGIRCLRLLDERMRAQEVASIVEEMKDGEAAVRLIDVARAFCIEFDSEALESHLGRAQRLGGLNEKQLRAKLLLLQAPNRSAELVRFLDEEWMSLSSNNQPEFLVIMKVQALAQTGDFDGATAFLNTHATEVGEAVLARLKLMLRDAQGEDPTEAAVELFTHSDAIEDLRNLVNLLHGRKQWKRLAPYTELLFKREPNFDNAMLRFNCLRHAGFSAKEICAFLDATVDQVEQRPELRSARAWAQFEAGNHLEAKRLNDELLSQRDNVNDLALDVNLAIRTGDWERFASIGVRAWERRDQLNGRMLLMLARLVGFADPVQALTLVQEAVEREGDDPEILVGANTIGVAAGRDDLAMPWMHKAAELSKEGGPVSVFAYREMVDFMRSSADSWRQKSEMYRTAQIPLHMAASLFNVPFSQLLIAAPRQNASEVDTRRRNPVPIHSGQRLLVAQQKFSRVALDVTALFVLSELGRLGAVLDSFDEVFISPRFMDVLLDDRGRVAFHQPSRIAEVKPLSGWAASGRLKVLDAKASADLAAEVGDEAAVLLKEAESNAGIFVHPGTLFEVASFMDKEAALGELESRLADPIDVLDALREEGVITQAESDVALKVLQSRGMTKRQSVPPATPLYLDGLAVKYLQDAKILQPLLNSGHAVTINKSTVDEWQALLATEPMAAELSESLDALRQTVRAGLVSGKVKFLAQNRKTTDGLNATTMLPMVDLLEDIEGIQAVVLDDRMLGQNGSISDSTGRSVPLLSSLDLLEMLVREERMSVADRREALHLMRARCFYCLPIDTVDVEFYLGQAVVEDGKLKETAELRTIRQYLALLNASDVLCTPADFVYQQSLWRVATLVIVTLWTNTAIPVVEASAKSDWVLANLLPDPELAMRFTPDWEVRIDETVAAQLGMSLMLPSNDPTRRDAYCLWLERSRLSMLLPANSRILDLVANQTAQSIVRQTLEITNEIRSKNCTDSAQ